LSKVTNRKQLKRLVVPTSWHVGKKKHKFITRPRPGMHSLSEGMPISIIIRDILKYAKTSREVKTILREKRVLVDVKRVKDPRFIAGLMDSISFPDINTYFRITLGPHGRLRLIDIKKEEALLKLCRIKGKHATKGGRIQLSTHDGRCITATAEGTSYKTGDSLLLEPEKAGISIKEHFALKPGASALVTGGKNKGAIGNITRIEGVVVTLKSKKEEITIPRRYAFVLGNEMPALRVEPSASSASH